MQSTVYIHATLLYTDLSLAVSCTEPVSSCPALTKMGREKRQRIWYQCVRGWKGAVDSHIVRLREGGREGGREGFQWREKYQRIINCWIFIRRWGWDMTCFSTCTCMNTLGNILGTLAGGRSLYSQHSKWWIQVRNMISNYQLQQQKA